MNKYINGLAGYLKDHKIGYSTADDNEDILWFKTKLPDGSADVLYFISYNEKEQSFIMLINHIAKFTEVRTELMKLMNDFDADPLSFNCKMYIDQQGELIVNCCAIIKSGEVVEQMIDYIDMSVVAIQKYYPEIVKVTELSASSN